MSTEVFVCSAAVAFCAIAVPQGRTTLRRLLDFLRGIRSPRATVVEPKALRENGWALIQCDDVESFEEWLGKDSNGLPHGNEEEPSLGSHLLIELFGCEPQLLEQEVSVATTMIQAARESEATIVEESFHEFKPYGVSGAVIIQESHYTIHTWPEHGYAAVDLFYCGGTVKVARAVETLRQRFLPQRIKFLIVRRGIESEVRR